MKVLFPYDGISLGGSHISSIILKQHLIKKYEVVVCLFQKGIFSEYLDKKSIKYSLLPYNSYIVLGNGVLRLIRIILTIRLIPYLKKNQISVVHTNEMNMHLTWFLPCLLTRTKHIWHQRTPNNKSIHFSYFSNVIAVSNYTKDSFPSFIQKSCQMIYNPFIIKKGMKKITLKEPYKLAFVGNLIPRKNISVFIEIIKSLGLNVEGYVFGKMHEPEYTKAKSKIKEYQLDHKIQFMGVVFPLEDQLEKMDLVISPATEEALGRNIIESMSMGIPVLAVKSGGNTEIISNELDGYLITDNKIQSYVKKITLILDNPDEYKKISINAIKKVKLKFDASIHIKKMELVYKEIEKTINHQ